MVARFFYRAVALFFFVGAGFCLVTAVACLVVQISGLRFDVIALGVWAAVLAYLLSGASSDAWRAARWY
jgi:hypothetical protein